MQCAMQTYGKKSFFLCGFDKKNQVLPGKWLFYINTLLFCL